MRDGCLFLSTGELSGDLYASEIIKRFRRNHPQWQIGSLGGQLSREAGAEVLEDTVSLATVGVWEVFTTFRRWYEVWQKSTRWIQINRPDLVLIIDNPGFNLRLARYCRKMGIPVVSFVPPQVWAWGKRRARALARYAERILTLFPWESQYFERWKGRVEWVGHPLLQMMPDPVFFAGPSQAEKIVFLPGSRRKEIVAFLEVLATLYPLLQSQLNQVDLVIVLARPEFRELVHQTFPGNPFTLYDHESRYEAWQGATLCVSTSGTVTLEVALTGIPQMIVYRVSKPTFWLARLVLNQRFLGLPNIIMDREVSPELLQNNFTAQRIMQTIDQIRKNVSEFQQQAQTVSLLLREKLNRKDVFDNVVRVIEEVCEHHSSSK